MSLIQLKDVTFQPGQTRILSIPHLAIATGETIGIIGPNGAGKSTLLKILASLEQPSTGAYWYNDKQIPLKNFPIQIRRKMAFVMQRSFLFNTTVFDNIASGLKIRGENKEMITRKVNDWLSALQIEHLAARRCYKLSGGEAQRVNIARALATEPEILFLDEPFSGIDVPSKVDLAIELKRVIEEKQITIVIVSHDLAEVQFLTERLLYLEAGCIAQEGRTRDVLREPNELARPFINKLKMFTLATES